MNKTISVGYEMPMDPYGLIDHLPVHFRDLEPSDVDLQLGVQNYGLLMHRYNIFF
jgi:hypothetical protein